MMVPSVTDLRRQLIDELRCELIGPRSDDELLSDPPTIEYLTGILYPSGIDLPSEEDEKLELDSVEDDDDETDDGLVILSQTMNPASLGLSFAVEYDADQLEIEVAYGLYTMRGEKRTDGWQRYPFTSRLIVSLLMPGGRARLENGWS